MKKMILVGVVALTVFSTLQGASAAVVDEFDCKIQVQLKDRQDPLYTNTKFSLVRQHLSASPREDLRMTAARGWMTLGMISPRLRAINLQVEYEHLSQINAKGETTKAGLRGCLSASYYLDDSAVASGCSRIDDPNDPFAGLTSVPVIEGQPSFAQVVLGPEQTHTIPEIGEFKIRCQFLGTTF